MDHDTMERQPVERDKPLSISQLTGRIKSVLESSFPSVWVVGEITDLARPRSGHVYLTLKDEQSQVRAVMWRSTVSHLKFDLVDGQEVLCRGDIDVYLPRGSYQLVVRHMEPRGVGTLQQRLLELQKKLAAEGLFESRHKQPLPAFPRRVAVITSPTGAAIRDFLEVVRHRWQGVEVLVIPTRVQGEGAGAEIACALRLANRVKPSFDVLVVTRGGGSMEDLWCFNEEVVVREIFASSIPVVSAVGHEIDVTLSDLVADVRALTPTEAAQLVFPSADEIRQSLRHFHARLASSLNSVASAARMRLDALAGRRVFRRPLERVQELERWLDELHARTTRASRAMMREAQQQLRTRASQLESLSPLGVLSRGYTVTQRAEDGQVLRDAGALRIGDQILTRYAAGRSISRVESLEPQEGVE